MRDDEAIDLDPDRVGAGSPSSFAKATEDRLARGRGFRDDKTDWPTAGLFAPAFERTGKLAMFRSFAG